ncbi:MAG: glutathione S-transferase family protein [Rhizobiaceae bacterium]|nr:glutathione S-transferase family protein [Rhizobiaceae bacterium]
MLKIYGVYRSRASRNYWMARELGIAFEGVPVIQARRLADPEAPDAVLNTRSAAFLTINPNGQIPAIDDDGLVLWESIAINLYLARKHRGPLAAQSLEEEGMIENWSFWAVNEIEPEAVRIVLTHDAAIADTPGGRDAVAASTRLLRRPFEILDRHLATTDYLIGNRFTVADLNVAEICRYAMSESALTEAHPHLVAWYERCHDRPAFRDMWAARSSES